MKKPWISLGGALILALGFVAGSALGQENTQSELAQQVVNNARLSRQLAELRMERIRTLARSGQQEALRQEVESYREAIDSSIQELQRASSLGANVETALQEVDRATQHHGEVLSGLLDQVPEQARPAIERAMEVSQTGRQTALSSLQSLQEGSRPRPQDSVARSGPRGEPISTPKVYGPQALPPQAAGLGRERGDAESGEWTRHVFPKSDPSTAQPGYSRGEEKTLSTGRGSFGPPAGLGPSFGRGGFGSGSRGGSLGGPSRGGVFGRRGR